VPSVVKARHFTFPSLLFGGPRRHTVNVCAA
jgi:hypothetical protein